MGCGSEGTPDLRNAVLLLRLFQVLPPPPQFQLSCVAAGSGAALLGSPLWGGAGLGWAVP